jgi:predicted small lipoprotein YifL
MQTKKGPLESGVYKKGPLESGPVGVTAPSREKTVLQDEHDSVATR